MKMVPDYIVAKVVFLLVIGFLGFVIWLVKQNKTPK
jgi:preprotein translocase subunit Sss1